MFNSNPRPLISSRWALLAALLLGASVPFAFAPYAFSTLAVLAPALWLLLLRGAAPKVAARLGFAFGFGLYGVGVNWVYISIHVFGHSPLPAAIAVMLLLVAYMSLFPMALTYLCARYRVPATLAMLLVLPAGWVLAEWLRSWLFTGFAWLNLGYTQIDSPLSGYAPVLGVYGVSWLTAISAGLLAWTLSTAGRARWLGPLLFVLLWGGGAQLKQSEWTQAAGAPLNVSLIQGNIPQDEKWDPAQEVATLQKYVDLTRGEWAEQGTRRVDLVIWPETAIPAFQHEVADSFLQPLGEEARSVGTDLLTGIPVYDSERDEYYNAVISVGREQAAYYKHHLVPFGEYLPLRDILGTLLQVMPLPVADFSAGKLGQPLLRVAGYPVGVSICYEIIFGEEMITQLPQAAFLVNVSNDAWFGDSLAPHQHLEMARMRALETGRSLLRATNTGITAIIGPDGGIRERGPQFETLVLRGAIEPRSGSTPYVRWGNWPVVTITSLIVALVFLGRMRRR